MHKKGFTLIELLIAVTIVGVITSIASINNSTFGNTIALSNIAYDIALDIRNAQILGISVQQDRFGNFSAGYGIYVNDTYEGYVSFGDTDENSLYAGGAQCSQSNECISQNDLQRSVTIKRICAYRGAQSYCSDKNEIDALHITYVRPDPVALITEDGVTFFDRAEIVL